MTDVREAASEPAVPPGPRRTRDVVRRFALRFPWLYEILLVLFGYGLYTFIRNSVHAQESEAVGRAVKIERLEKSLHIFHEHLFNDFVAAHHWLAYVCNYYYATLHFVVTIAVGGWVLYRHPAQARGARIAWYGMTCLALIGFAYFSLAPPRLMPGFVDTVVQFHTWGSWGDQGVASHSNQYAAMPSLHIGWSLWCAVVLVKFARHRITRILGALYPVATLFVIVGTANHYFLDAVGGIVVLIGGWAIARLLLRRPVFEVAPPDPEPERPSAVAGAGTKTQARP